MQHNQPKEKKITKNIIEIERDDITIQNNKKRYGEERRFSIAYSDYIEELLSKYLLKLRSGEKTMGYHLTQYFTRHDIHNVKEIVEELTPLDLYQALLRTRLPVFFAERDGKFDGSDWDEDEYEILTLAANTTEVSVYDNGSSGYNTLIPFKFYDKPAKIHLLHLFAPLLKEGSPDYKKLVDEDGNLKYKEYYETIRDRWMPELLKYNMYLEENKKKGLVNIPGLGCGVYSGKFKGIVGEFLNQAIRDILENYSDELKNITGIVFDPFDECEGSIEDINRQIKYVVAPSATGHPYPLQVKGSMGAGGTMVLGQLASTEDRVKFFNTLFFRQWDPLNENEIESSTTNPGDGFADIGCDVVAGHKVTADGRNVGGTDAMAVHTGVEGIYNKQSGSPYLQARYSRYKSLKDEEEDQGYGSIFLEKRDELLPVNNFTVTLIKYEKKPPLSHFNIKSNDALYLMRLFKLPLATLMKSGKVKKLSEADGEEKIKLKKEYLIEALKLNDVMLATLFEPRVGCDNEEVIDFLYNLSEENLEVFLDCFSFTAKAFPENSGKNNELSDQLKSSLTHFTMWNYINYRLAINIPFLFFGAATGQSSTTVNIYPIKSQLELWGDRKGSILKLFSPMHSSIIGTLLQYSHQLLLSLYTSSYILPSLSSKLNDFMFEKVHDAKTLYDLIKEFDKTDIAEQYYEYGHIIASHGSADGQTYRIYMLVPNDAEDELGQKHNKLVEFLFLKKGQNNFEIRCAEKRLETSQQFKDQIGRVCFDFSNRHQANYLDTKELSPYMKDDEVPYPYSDTSEVLLKLNSQEDDPTYRESYEKLFREKATITLINLYYYEQTLDTGSLSDYQGSDAPGKAVFIEYLNNLTQKKIEEILQKPISQWNFLLMMECIPILRKAERAAEELKAAVSASPAQTGRGRSIEPPKPQDDVPVLLDVELYKEQMSILKLGMDIPVQPEWQEANSFIAWLKMNGILGMNCEGNEIQLVLSSEDGRKFFKTWGSEFNLFETDTRESIVTLSLRQWEQLKNYYVAYIQKKSTPEEQLFYRTKLLNEVGATFGLLGKRKGLLAQNFRGAATDGGQKQDFHAFATFKKVLENNKTKDIDKETISVLKQYIRAYITLNYSILSNQQIDALTKLSNNEAHFIGKKYTKFVDLIDIMFDDEITDDKIIFDKEKDKEKLIKEKLISKVPNSNLLIADLKAQFPQYQNHSELAIRLRTFSDNIGNKITGKIKESLLKNQKLKTQSSGTIRVKQYEKDAYDYIYINENGDVSIFAPVLRGHIIGTDNTCHAKDEFNRFLNQVEKSIEKAINDISNDIKILEISSQSKDALTLKQQKLASLKKWKDYFASHPLNKHTHLYEDIKAKFEKSNVVTILQHPYSQDNYLNLGTLPPHDPHPESGYTSAFSRSAKSCAIDLFNRLSYQPKKKGLLQKIKSSVLKRYDKEYINSDATMDPEQEIESLKQTIINVLKEEYQYYNIPTFKMSMNSKAVGGKFTNGEPMDVTFKNIVTTIDCDDTDSIPTENVFDCLLNEAQENWENISLDIRSRNLFLTEDWKKFGAIAQFFVNSLVALHYSKGGEKISLGQIVEDGHPESFIRAVVTAYNNDESFVERIFNIISRYISEDITANDAYEFFYELFKIIDGSLHYDDFLLLTNNIKEDQTNFVTLKSKISINLVDLKLCPEQYLNDKFIPKKVDLESINATLGLQFDLNPEDYLGKTPPEIASFLLLDTDQDTKVWKVVSDEFMKKMAAHPKRDLILKAISEDPFISTSQYTAILQRFGITDVFDVDKQMFTWLNNICLIKDPHFLYKTSFLTPAQKLSQILTTLGCGYNIQPVGPDKDGSFSVRCDMAKMRSVIEDAADSRDCLYLHQALVGSIYKLALSSMTEEERQNFERLSPKDEMQISDQSKIIIALKYLFAGSKYDIAPDAYPYNTSYNKDRILVKMHSQFGYALQCFNHDTLLKIKDELELIHERASRLAFDKQESNILFPQLNVFTAEAIKEALNGSQVKNKIFTLSEVSVVDDKCFLSLDRDNFALLIYRAISQIRSLPFSAKIMKAFNIKEPDYFVKNDYFKYLESSFINSLCPEKMGSEEFAENNRSKTAEDLRKEFIEPIKEFQHNLAALADEVLQTTIFINPLEVDLILRTVERSQNKEELYKEFIKDPNKVMLEALDALNSLQKSNFAFSTLQKIESRKDINKSDANQILCYKPLPSHFDQNNNHSCAIVCKNKEEYHSLNTLIEKAKEMGKRHIFERDDILLLLGEKHNSKLDNKKLLTRLQNKYKQFEWELDGEHFSAPLEFDVFINLALEAYNNNPIFLAGEEIPIQLDKDGKPIDNTHIKNYYKNELDKNKETVNAISKQNWGSDYSNLKYTTQDIYQACFVKNREILRQLQFFLPSSSRCSSCGGGYVKIVVREAQQSMTVEESNVLDALKIRDFLGSDPNPSLMVAKKILPDKHFTMSTDKNLKLHKDDGYFCMILPDHEAKYTHAIYFYTPTAQETNKLSNRINTEVLKIFFTFDNKIKKIIEVGEQDLKYDIVEDGKVKVYWTGTKENREQVAKLLHTKCLNYYSNFLEKFKILQRVESDKFSLIYKKFKNNMVAHQQEILIYLNMGNYRGSKKDTDKFTDDRDLEKFFGEMQLFITVAEEAQAEMEPLLKQCQLFNFSNHDISLFLGYPYDKEIEINEKELIAALDKQKIKYSYIEKTADGWAIQFDRDHFVQFAKLTYENLKKQVKISGESKKLDQEIQDIIKEYSLNQKDIQNNEAFFQAHSLEEDERSGQVWRERIHHLIFEQYPQSLKKSKSPVVITRDDVDNVLPKKQPILIPVSFIESPATSFSVDPIITRDDADSLSKEIQVDSPSPSPTVTAESVKPVPGVSLFSSPTHVHKVKSEFERIKESLMESTPYKNLIDHMAGSRKWRQINAYLVGIKSATTIEDLIRAVKADPKDIDFEITPVNLEAVVEEAKQREIQREEKKGTKSPKSEWDLSEMEPNKMRWTYEKSMRENTGWWGIYAWFNRGRSQTETYALELGDVLKQLLSKNGKKYSSK